MVDIKKYCEKDLYELLGVQHDATESEIRKAYRKKALDCHPDKNPDNPKAAELFQELSKILEILTDKSAKSAYDKILNAKKAAKIRNQKLDSKRQKLKADLEERERNCSLNPYKAHGYSTPKTDEEILQAEIERLRKEGSLLLQEEQELMKKQLSAEKIKLENQYNSSQHKIKIKWKVNADPKLNYTEEVLKNYFKKYGDIVAIVVSSKNSSALIEFKTQDAGEMAVAYEKGNLLNPLHLEWIGEPPKKNRAQASSTISDLDFESLVLRQMRQAEERKRLIDQMMKEDTKN
ncbi:dnaJ homolog subfamily C member 17 [Condylostylus longicornis]|uniref:dnaJ homolog subfamily C member 17 n=1 Tax=Condylostylus longicornis TaxID=2530218 RepID=UPI00244DE3A5|nr:dnaJ homolog subfamily C member 17 [Condylostylus longicornis]